MSSGWPTRMIWRIFSLVVSKFELEKPGESHAQRLVALQNFHLRLLTARGQRGVELEHAVEMILNRALVAAGHEDEMLDAGFLGLVDDILDQGLVDDGQHLFRHRLGGGQDAGAETGDREDGFANFHGLDRDPDGKATERDLTQVGSRFAAGYKG